MTTMETKMTAFPRSTNVAFAVAMYALLAVGVWCGQAAMGQVQGGQGGAAAQTPTSNPVLETLTVEERAWLREHPVIRVTQDPSWPPIEFADEQGEPSGIANDYVKLIEQKLGITFERVRNLSWQESYARLKRWDLDMTTSVAVTPERMKFWAFTKPYMSIPIVILTHADVTYITGLHELAGKKTAVVDGYIAAEFIPRDFPDIQLVKVKTVKEGLDLLRKGEVFALIDNMLIMGHYLAKMQLVNLKIAGETPYVNAQCMAVRKDWAIFAGILQKALDSVSEKERAELFSKWAPIRYEHGFNYKPLWQAMVVFAVILAAMVVWNRKLSREIRDRKEAQAALKSSEQRFRRLLDVASVPLCLVNKEGVLVDFNKRFIETFGYTHEDVPTLTEWWQLAYPDPDYRRWVMNTWETAVRRAAEEKTIVEPIEYRVTCKSGEVRTVVISGAIIGDDFLASLFDITDRKRAEEELSRHRDHLEELVKARTRELEESQQRLQRSERLASVGTFAAGIAHEINNPLGMMLLSVDLALESLDQPDQLAELLRQQKRDVARCSRIVKGVLDFARHQPTEKWPLDLNQVVRHGMDYTREYVQTNGVSLNADLPDTAVPVMGNATELEQVVVNLIHNAVQACDQRGHVTIEMHETADTVRLMVCDDGCGMAPEQIEHAFDPFYTTRLAKGGTGLGLSTVHGIVTSHGGTVEISSNMGRGSVFTIAFPRCSEAIKAHNEDHA